MKYLKSSFDALVYLVILVLLSACDTQEQAKLSEQSIIYCSESSPESFNPQIVTSQTTIDATSNQFYNRLITYQANNDRILPSLAKSWHVTRDGKMITFYLRKDVSFQQTQYFTPTRKLNADDVLFSFNRILNEDHPFHYVSGGQYPFFQHIKFNQLIESIEKINNHTVRFKLTQANSSILAHIATDFAVILSSEYAQQLASSNNHQQIDTLPIGTGPYKLKEYRVGSYIRYEPHQQYWGNKGAIKNLIFDITPSNTGRLTKLLAGECDVVSNPIAHEKIMERNDLSLNEVTSFDVSYLGFNTRKKPFDDKRIRQAIALAINKQTIIDTVYFGRAELADALIPQNSWAFDKSLSAPRPSIDMAKKLLLEAGIEQEFTIELWLLSENKKYNPDPLTMARLIKADLKEIGINVQIIEYEQQIEFLAGLEKGQHQAALLGWAVEHSDPNSFFTPLLSCDATTQKNNKTFWCDQDFDNALQKSLQTTNKSRRKKYYSTALAIINEEKPLIPIAHSKRFQAKSNKVQGKTISTIGGINFNQVRKL